MGGSVNFSGSGVSGATTEISSGQNHEITISIAADIADALDILDDSVSIASFDLHGLESPLVCRRLVTSCHATISNVYNFA